MKKIFILNTKQKKKILVSRILHKICNTNQNTTERLNIQYVMLDQV